MQDFVHLHTHTEFSLLDGLSSPQALATHAAELGMTSLAVTDHGVMYGVVDFYKACKAASVKPIIGMEAYVAHNSRTDHDRLESKPYHLIILAQNQAGYQNLLKLASIAQTEGFYYKPRVDKELLAAHSEGLIILSACAQGEIPQLLFQGQDDHARQAARWYQEHFPDRFYLELQSHDIPEFDIVYQKMIALGQDMGIPLVATNDIHYARREQADAHDVLLCIQTGKTVNEPNRMRMTDASYYMRSPEEMAALYAHVPGALENTLKIAEQCNVELQFAPPYHLPKFPVPEGFADSTTYLRALCDQGLVEKYGVERAADPEVRERLDYELGIIHEMGFDDYFLIVRDLGEAAKERDIWWNVRGSAAGSVAAYTLGITSIDPLRNRLLFERFLNPARISMPDIDLDYPDDRRSELIAYTVDRYGADKVAAIITFGTLGARAAVRDVGRALDIPLGEVDRVARLIPNVPGKPMSITEALENVPDLAEVYQRTPYIKKLLDTATQVEGVTRHASTHAAGILISDRPLVDYLPLHRPTKGDGEDSPVGHISQWAMEVVDDLGMLKVDFLGLRTLTHMRKTCELIEQEHGRKLDMNTIPYERVPDDPEKDADVVKLYELLGSGETTGVFQVEGAGMRRTLREMRPTQFQHIAAAIALYRPGPMESIPGYIRRLHGEESIEYHHPLLETILDDTFGIIVYQEQIMQIAVTMAGYKPGEADMIRKAVAKKKTKQMEMHQRMFREGAAKRDISEEIANKVWGDIEYFARYGFNRAHAVDYAVITGQTAYLKAHYPLEFMTALMTTECHSVEKLGSLIIDARRTGLEVRRPSINHSDLEFTIEHLPKGERFIRIGLAGIKNVSKEAMSLIVEARKRGGPFKSLDDFADRIDLRKLNRKTLECLIQAGALDDFAPRPALMALVDTMLNSSVQIHSARDVGQFTLFDNMAEMRQSIQLPAFTPPISDRKLLEGEKELLGTYISKHPLLDQERELLAQSVVTTTVDRISNEPLGQQLSLVGMVQRVRRITTKKGDMMAFVTLEGSGGTLETVVFPRVYERCKDMLTPDRVLVVSGKLDNRPDREDHALLADWFKPPQDLPRPAGSSDLPGSDFERPSYGMSSPDASPFYDDDPPPYAEIERPARVQEPASPPYRPAVAARPPLRGEGDRPAGPQRSSASRPSASSPEGALPKSAPVPSSMLYVTLERSGDSKLDFERLAQLHNLLRREDGRDRFMVVLQGAGQKSIELEFPNEHTQNSVILRKQVEAIVGVGNLRVIPVRDSA